MTRDCHMPETTLYTGSSCYLGPAYYCPVGIWVNVARYLAFSRKAEAQYFIYIFIWNLPFKKCSKPCKNDLWDFFSPQAACLQLLPQHQWQEQSWTGKVSSWTLNCELPFPYSWVGSPLDTWVNNFDNLCYPI